MNVLFIVLWIAIGFFTLRFAAVRIFHEPRRAEIASGAIVVAFAIGSVWPYSERVGGSLQTTAVATTALSTSPPPDDAVAARQTLKEIDVTKECRLAKAPFARGLDIGSLDVIRTVPAVEADASITIADIVSRSTSFYVEGWAADVLVQHAAKAVCLLVDGHTLSAGSSLVGILRPDVASGYHRSELASSGYQISIPASTLTLGTHRLQIIAENQNRIFGLLPVERTITVN